MTSLLAGLIAQGHSVQGVAVSGSWGEVDNADDLALYERMYHGGEIDLSP